MDKPRVAFVVGTRPDAIKSAPTILEFQRHFGIETLVFSTGQHREMLASVFAAFNFRPTLDLEIMRHGQSLAEMTARTLEGLDKAIGEHMPNYVIAQGDTTTTFVASLAAFYSQLPFGHIEAGLRTESIANPFPEEFNRRASGLIATHHFAPTRWAANNLLREGKDERSIFVTGNTGIDAVRMIAQNEPKSWFPDHPGRIILLTTHRRENWGDIQAGIARAARTIIEATTDALLVVPMHRNPAVRETLQRELDGAPRTHLIEPPDYDEFVPLMKRSNLILSDSGGVQEEAPAFGVPVLVLRDTTERPEGVQAGTAKLIGTDPARIVAEARELLDHAEAYARMANAVSPYGDGNASARIASVVLPYLGVSAPSVTMWN